MLTGRTVSSDSSSSESEKPTAPPPPSRSQANAKTETSPEQAHEIEEVSSPQSPQERQEQRPKNSEQAFEEFYLKQATKEFANDIDKLRSAPDFNERHIPVLIRALRQGTASFGKEERMRVGNAAS